MHVVLKITDSNIVVNWYTSCRHISVLALSHWGGLHGLTKSSRHCSLVSSTRTNVSYNHSTTKQEWCTQVFIAEEEEEAWPRVWPLQDPDPCPMLPKKRTLQKKSSEYYTRTTPACSSWTGGYGGGSWTPWPTSRRWGRPTFVALARAIATEGASQSDFVPVTTGDLCGCPVGQGLAPHQPTLSGLLQLAAAAILLQHYDEFHDIFRSVWSLLEFDQKQQRVNGGRSRESGSQQSTTGLLNWE